MFLYIGGESPIDESTVMGGRILVNLIQNTRLHSSRMRTGRSLTVCCSLLPGGGCLPGLGGVCLVWGGSPWSGGVLLGPGGFSLVRGGVLLGPGGSPWSRGGFSLVPGGVSLVRGGFSGDPPCGQNHRHL